MLVKKNKYSSKRIKTTEYNYENYKSILNKSFDNFQGLELEHDPIIIIDYLGNI